MGAIDNAVVDYLLFGECYKHGPKSACSGKAVAVSKEGNSIECDPSLPHCSECGRILSKVYK